MSFRPAWAAASRGTSRGGGLRGRRPGDDRRPRARRSAQGDCGGPRVGGAPVAVNLLLPFARARPLRGGLRGRRGRHFLGPAQAPDLQGLDAPVRLGRGGTGGPRGRRRRGDRPGREAGGHVRGTVPAADLLGDCAAVPDDYPVLSAGGIADAADVRARLDAGAEAVVCGTRFLMTEESGAHANYKERLREARETSSPSCSASAGRPAPRRRERGHGPLAAERSARSRVATCVPQGDRARCLACAGAAASSAWQRRRTRAGQCSVPPRRSPRTAEPGRGGPALRGRVHRPDRRHPPGGRAGPRAGRLARPARRRWRWLDIHATPATSPRMFAQTKTRSSPTAINLSIANSKRA